MEERRRYVRLDTRLEITYTILKKGEETPTESETRDISGGGIRIFLKEPLAPQTFLKLCIRLPEDTTPIECVGKIIWMEAFSVLQEGKEEKRYESGVQFTEIDPKDRDRIIKYVILGYSEKK